MPRTALLARLLTATIISLTAARSAAAQAASPFIGSWSVEYEVGRMMQDGEATGIRGTGAFKIVPAGDSLLITIQPPARPDGSVPAPVTVGARATDGRTTFVQRQKVRINVNGEESTRDVELTWTLTASGDALTGTLVRKMPDMPEEGAPSVVKGTRVKG